MNQKLIKEKLSVVGLGKVGLCLASVLGNNADYNVLGMDISKDTVDKVNKKEVLFYEKDLDTYLKEASLEAITTKDADRIIGETDTTFIVVPTPSKKNNRFSNKYIKSTLKVLSKHLKESDKKYHLFVLVSTVSPGSCKEKLIPYIEEVSGRKFNEGFGFCYNPEFIALGNVIHNIVDPDFVLIGDESTDDSYSLKEIYKKICGVKVPIRTVSLAEAEIVKIAVNTYITMKISFANSLANVCERVPNVSVDRVTSAIGSDSRIGSKYLSGGLGFGGPCFPRDTKAFSRFFKDNDLDAHLAEASNKVNEFQIENLYNIIKTNISNDNKVSFLGITYKPDTYVIEESQIIKVIDKLLMDKYEIFIYDKRVSKNTIDNIFDREVTYIGALANAKAIANCCVVSVRDEEFKSLKFDRMITVIDCWRMIDPLNVYGKHIRLGVGK